MKAAGSWIKLFMQGISFFTLHSLKIFIKGQVFVIFIEQFLFSLRYRWFSGIDEDGKPGIQQGVRHSINNSKVRESDKHTNYVAFKTVQKLEVRWEDQSSQKLPASLFVIEIKVFISGETVKKVMEVLLLGLFFNE